MVKRQVVWTSTAIQQRRAVLIYWKKRNKSSYYSEKLIYLISSRLHLLAQEPEIGVATEIIGVRASVLGHFSLLYKASDNQIIVVGFWDNRQDPKKLIALLGL